MNYRHSFHAGNFADVLKHFVLTRVIAHLKRKPTPFRVIDTHAGTGLYDLSSTEAEKTGEWRAGIGRLLAAELPEDVATLFRDYFDVLAAFNPELRGADGLRRYPGSPVIAARLLRDGDTLIANELHPVDFDLLKAALGPQRNAKVMNLDGYTVLKSTLPPKERRGLVLIDPPFEDAGELTRMVTALRNGVKRFATGSFMMWYPIKDPRPVAAFKRELCALRLEKLLAVELFIQAAEDVSRLNGNGLILLNPPYTLAEELERSLPFLVEILGQNNGARFEISNLGAATAG